MGRLKAKSQVPRTKFQIRTLNLVLGIWFLEFGCLRAAELDLNKAVVVSPNAVSKQEKKALALLVEEVEKRTLVRWQVSSAWPAESTPVVAVGQASSLAQFAGPHAAQLARSHPLPGADCYEILIEKTGRPPPAVLVSGTDFGGVLSG